MHIHSLNIEHIPNKNGSDNRLIIKNIEHNLISFK